MADALVHEWIDGRAGSEQVFEALAAAMPHAQLLALTQTPDTELNLFGRRVQTSMLDVRLTRNRRGVSAPAMPLAWRALARGRTYDTVLVSHHAFASQFARWVDCARALAYVHTPARYLWTPELDGRGGGHLLAPVRRHLKRVDRRAVEHLDHLAANSRDVADRIERFWNREATVIAPPVDTDFYGLPRTPPRREYLLGVSRFVGYKRLDLVIEVGELMDLPVVIAGWGPDEQSLRARAESATVPVEIVVKPTNTALRDLFRGAVCLVFPAHEDFGIVPVESQASGTPVVGLSVGGTLDSVRDGVTGRLVDEPRAELLAEAVREVEGFTASACRSWAEQFSTQRFIDQVSQWMQETA